MPCYPSNARPGLLVRSARGSHAEAAAGDATGSIRGGQ